MATASFSASGSTFLCFLSDWALNSVPSHLSSIGGPWNRSGAGHHFVSYSTGLTKRLYSDLAYEPDLMDFP